MTKIWKSKFVEHDLSRILSTEEKLLSFCNIIGMQEVINIPNKNLNINIGDSSKKLGTDIGRS